MATANSFGRISKVSFLAGPSNGGTILKELFFEAPYKIIRPFPLSDGMIRVMLMSASAGIMAGDEQEFSIRVESGAKIEFISQSYEKIHQMEEGEAVRRTVVTVEPSATCIFNPQPTIPFADSAFVNKTDVYLADGTSNFIMSEILCCGRAVRDELFQYKKYHNLVHIYRGERLVYRDNSIFNPERYNMSGFGMYEKFTHMGNIFISKFLDINESEFETSLLHLLQEEQNRLNVEERVFEGVFTRLESGDYVVRLFGMRAQVLEECIQRILSENSTTY